jgi:proteasome lid subunit RPN8/RPN11
MRPVCVIRPEAWIAMEYAALEGAFAGLETGAFVIGRPGGKLGGWEVSAVIPITVYLKRTTGEVLWTSELVEYAEELAEHRGLKVLGHYHTHPAETGVGLSPSTEDIVEAQQGVAHYESLELIGWTWPGKRHKWRFQAGAWIISPERGRPRRMKIERSSPLAPRGLGRV